MTNLASPLEGTAVILASSNDENYPPEAIIDGNPNTFWLSTGIFPQQVIISFRAMVSMDTILLRCSKVSRLRLERSETAEPNHFETITEKDTELTDDDLQPIKFELPKTMARHLKLVIVKSLDHFVSLHSLVVTGTVVR